MNMDFDFRIDRGQRREQRRQCLNATAVRPGTEHCKSGFREQRNGAFLSRDFGRGFGEGGKIAFAAWRRWAREKEGEAVAEVGVAVRTSPFIDVCQLSKLVVAVANGV